MMLFAANSLSDQDSICNRGVFLYQTSFHGWSWYQECGTKRLCKVGLYHRFFTVPIHGENARLLRVMATLFDLDKVRLWPNIRPTAKCMANCTYGVPKLRHRLVFYTASKYPVM
jgi:hypothetical protein